MVLEMDAPRTPNEFPVNGADFIQKIAPYEAESEEGNLSLTFWHRALADFAMQGEIYVLLFEKLKAEFEDVKHSQAVLEAVVAQLALESSFLSQPLARDAAYVHFIDDQQLVYSYVDIDKLARSEFACTDIVIGMIQDIIGNSSRDECLIAPITVANCYPICSSHDGRAVIIDGNNRTATIGFLRFVSIYGVPNSGETDNLREYCRDYGLGPVCFVDLYKVMDALWQSYPDIIQQLKNPESASLFRRVRQLPALVTEESSFFTKTLLDAEENVLQPVHQSIFATDDLLVAFPGKMQSHGRARGFKAMPVR
ncbi:hypothetical protein F4808DRAFT_436392 [Astrocystis sublimbata]|nr:hypothetical protein F4808DRAFT_436392 [Astrocystis sublimbata]